MIKHFLIVIVTSATIFFFGTLRLSAQVQVVSDVVEKTDSLSQLSCTNHIDRLNKVLFAFGANILSFEPLKPYLFVCTGSHSFFDVSTYTVSLLEDFALQEEVELEIEDWMLQPFKKDYFLNCLVPQEEEELAIEPWMSDLGQWKL